MEKVPDFVKGEKVLSILGKFKYLCHGYSLPPKCTYIPLPPNYPQDG